MVETNILSGKIGTGVTTWMKKERAAMSVLLLVGTLKTLGRDSETVSRRDCHGDHQHCPLLPGLLCLSVLFLALRYE